MSTAKILSFALLFFISVMCTLAGVYLLRTDGEGAWLFMGVGLAGDLLLAGLCAFVPAVRQELFGSGF